MKTFENLDEALASGLTDKDIIKIWEANTPHFYVFVSASGQEQLVEFWTDKGREGLPDARLMKDNYMLAVKSSVFKVHDGYWVEFLGEVNDYRPTFDLVSIFTMLNEAFVPPPNCSAALLLVNDKLNLSVFYDNEPIIFHLDGQYELNDVPALVQSIHKLMETRNAKASV